MKELLITGNLTKDAEIKQGNDGTSFATFSVATNELKSGNKHTTYTDCIYSLRNNSNLAQYLTKGQKVLCRGGVSVDVYKTSSGEYKGSLRCRVFNLELLGGASQSPEPKQNGFASADEPF